MLEQFVRELRKGDTVACGYAAIILLMSVLSIAGTVLGIPNLIMSPRAEASPMMMNIVSSVCFLVFCTATLDLYDRWRNRTSATPFALPRLMVGIQFVMGTNKAQLVFAM